MESIGVVIVLENASFAMSIHVLRGKMPEEALMKYIQVKQKLSD